MSKWIETEIAVVWLFSSMNWFMCSQTAIINKKNWHMEHGFSSCLLWLHLCGVWLLHWFNGFLQRWQWSYALCEDRLLQCLNRFWQIYHWNDAFLWWFSLCEVQLPCFINYFQHKEHWFSLSVLYFIDVQLGCSIT